MGLLLNWLVQGTMVTAAVGAALALVRWRSAAGRHRAWQIALVVVLAQPLVSTAWTVRSSTSRNVEGMASEDRAGEAALVSVGPVVWEATTLPLSLAVLWSLWRAARLARELRALRAMRRRCLPMPADLVGRLPPATLARVAHVGARLTVSDDVRAAAALGVRRPFIALRTSLATRMSDAELDQMVLHEWAHIHRGDLGWALWERVAQALAGWHPAVAWMVGRIRVERELACDELTIAISGSGRAYATLLTRLAALTSPVDSLVVATHAICSSGLRTRVTHALAVDVRARPTAWGPIAAWGVGLALMAVAVSMLSVFGPRPRPEAARLVAALGDVVLAAPPVAESPRAPRTARRERSVATERRVGLVLAPPAGSALPTADPDRPQQEPPTGLVADERASAPEAPVKPAAIVVDGAQVLAAMSAPQDETPSFQVPPPARWPEKPADLVGLSVALARDSAQAGARAADAGAAVGRRSQEGATTAARFFTRFGKRVVSSVTSSRAEPQAASARC